MRVGMPEDSFSSSGSNSPSLNSGLPSASALADEYWFSFSDVTPTYHRKSQAKFTEDLRLKSTTKAGPFLASRSLNMLKIDSPLHRKCRKLWIITD